MNFTSSPNQISPFQSHATCQLVLPSSNLMTCVIISIYLPLHLTKPSHQNKNSVLLCLNYLPSNPCKSRFGPPFFPSIFHLILLLQSQQIKKIHDFELHFSSPFSISFFLFILNLRTFRRPSNGHRCVRFPLSRYRADSGRQGGYHFFTSLRPCSSITISAEVSF